MTTEVERMYADRDAFETAAYARYLMQHAAGKLVDSNELPCGPEGLFWKQPDGSYGVLMFNAAWWGWQQGAAYATACATR